MLGSVCQYIQAIPIIFVPATKAVDGETHHVSSFALRCSRIGPARAKRTHMH